MGLRWLNTVEVVRTDWSNDLLATAGQWIQINLISICNNVTTNLITELQLVIAVEGTMTHSDEVYFDDGANLF